MNSPRHYDTPHHPHGKRESRRHLSLENTEHEPKTLQFGSRTYEPPRHSLSRADKYYHRSTGGASYRKAGLEQFTARCLPRETSFYPDSTLGPNIMDEPGDTYGGTSSRREQQ